MRRPLSPYPCVRWAVCLGAVLLFGGCVHEAQLALDVPDADGFSVGGADEGADSTWSVFVSVDPEFPWFDVYAEDDVWMARSIACCPEPSSSAGPAPDGGAPTCCRPPLVG
ncbi:MAG: hypothetical protein KDA24_29230 [Deltaproteobacteria bacterium]|nr:hypothetical protein [Deltaproteobacteria bacterium]